MTIQDQNDIRMKVLDGETHIKMKVDEKSSGGTDDYRDLIHKPSINGTELIENYDEIDPTVPEWAKTENKPEYTPSEVGALAEDAEVSLVDVQTLFNMVFHPRQQ